MLFKKLKSRFDKWKSQIPDKQENKKDVSDIEEKTSEPKENIEDTLERKLDELLFDSMDILSEGLDNLSKEINRLGKSQLRSNTLADTERKQIKKSMLKLLEVHNNDQNDKPETGFIKDLLEIADGLEEAVKAAKNMPKKEQSVSNWLNGIQITKRRITKLFEKWDIRPIDAVGSLFDPNLHVSVDIKRTSNVPENTIVEEQRSGYLLGNKVIRYAEVVVAKPQSMEDYSTPAETPDKDEDEISQESTDKSTSDSSSQGFILWANDDFID